MANFGVKTQILDGAAGTMESEAAKMLSLYNELISVKNNLNMRSSASGIIKSRLQGVAGDLKHEKTGMKNMAEALRQVSSLYDTYEGRIIDNANGRGEVDITNSSDSNNANSTEKKEGSGSEAGTVDSKPGFDWGLKDLILGGIGGAGVAGGGVSGVAKFIMGDKKDPKTWVSAFKDGISVGANVYENLHPNPGGAPVGIKDWFGLNAIPNGNGGFAASFKDAFGEELKKFTLGDNATTTDKVKVGCKWAGVALSLVKNGISNYQEAKNDGISATRAVLETVTETAVDVAVGIGAKAFATAVVGAVAATSFGPVVVGVAAVGVVWAADLGVKAINKYIFKEANPRGLTETVSDAILDTGKFVADNAAKAAKNVGKAVSSFGKSFAKWAFA